MKLFTQENERFIRFSFGNNFSINIKGLTSLKDAYDLLIDVFKDVEFTANMKMKALEKPSTTYAVCVTMREEGVNLPAYKGKSKSKTIYYASAEQAFKLFAHKINSSYVGEKFNGNLIEVFKNPKAVDKIRIEIRDYKSISFVDTTADEVVELFEKTFEDYMVKLNVLEHSTSYVTIREEFANPKKKNRHHWAKGVLGLKPKSVYDYFLKNYEKHLTD